MNYSTTEAIWVKFADPSEFAFVGKDILATASGIYIHFFNLKSREERIEIFDSEDRGDGVTCIAGHPIVSVFSVAESKSNPIITLFAYPSLRRITQCPSDGKTNAYLHCTFAGTDYLIGQTTFPDFRLIVWNWRTGERIAETLSQLNNIDRQMISCSNSSRLIGKFIFESGELEVYRLLICSKNIRLCRVEIPKISEHKITFFCWSEEKLYVCDEEGSLWWLDFDDSHCTRVITIGHAMTPGESPVITSYRAGILLANVDANTGGRVTFIRKSSEITGNDWRIIWTVSLTCYPRWMACQTNGDAIIIRSNANRIIQVIPPNKDRSSRLDTLYYHGKKYIDLCSMIYDRYLGVLDNTYQFSILDVFTGNSISSKLNLSHHGAVHRMESHRSLPIIATCSDKGNCLLIDINQQSSPRIKKCFHLQKEPLNQLKFSRKGSILGVSGSKVPHLFLIGANRSKSDQIIRVIGFIKIGPQLTDFLIYESEERDTLRILILSSSTPNEDSTVFSGKILVYSCKVSDEFLASPLQSIELPRALRSLYYAGEGKPEEIIGIPRLSKLLYRIQMGVKYQNGIDNGKEFVLKEVLPSLHLARNIQVNVLTSLSYILTCSDDGSIIIRDEKELRMVLAIFYSHHRRTAGVFRVTIVDDVVVSLGRNGDLIANRLSDLEKKGKNPEEKRARKKFLNSPWILLESNDNALVNDETWVDRVIRKKMDVERMKAQSIRLSIMSDLQGLRGKIKVALDSNDNEGRDSKLPVSDFDLDKNGRERKIARAKLQMQQVEKEIEETIARQDHATCYIRENFWKPLIVPPLTISGILGDSRVTNYPLNFNIPEDSEASASQLSPMKKLTYELSEDEESGMTELEEAGSTGWIDEPTMKITDDLLVPSRGYFCTLKLNSIIEELERKAKCGFNDAFNEIRQLKKNRIERIGERIVRLKECISELGQTFDAELRDAGSLSVDWNRDEIGEYNKYLIELERILERNREKCQSAISQASLESPRSSTHADNHISVNELNEVLSTDDFWDETLEKMMDGVLEVRWEDEVKKDIVKPDCLKNDPSKHTEEDVKTIADYENKLKAQRCGRQKYKLMLESEIARTTDEIWTSMHEFDQELEALGKKKIQAERTIFRHTLTRIRMISTYRNIALQKSKISRIIKENLIPATKESKRLTEECDLFESAITELKIKHDNLNKKEKQQEVKFRSEFPTLKQPMVEHLFRHFNRRPKIGSIPSTSFTFLTDLTRCIIMNCTSDILPRESSDFLRGLVILDFPPDSLPTQIDINDWRNMCRLRRAKFETEIKVKSCILELAEAEFTLSYFRKLSSTARSKMIRLKERVRDLERALTESKEDSEIGLVVKAGQVEIDLTGTPTDTGNAVLILREDLIRTNKAIVKAGERKLATLRYYIDLEKEILGEEWRHASMRTKMTDLRDYLDDLRGTKVTRIALECSRELGKSSISKGPVEKIEENLKESRQRLGKKLNEEKKQLEEAENQIEHWRKKNSELTSLLENLESECKSLLNECQASSRLREVNFRQRSLQAISRKLILSQKIRENSEELLGLGAHLEICRLRTYPTLTLKH